MGSCPIFTITSTTTSKSANWRWVPGDGASPEVRRALISSARDAQAFWWLPEPSDLIFLLKKLDDTTLAIVRSVGPFWEWVSLTSSFPHCISLPETLPDHSKLLAVGDSIPSNFSLDEKSYLGMFNPTSSQRKIALDQGGEAMCALRLSESVMDSHPGYPPPMEVHLVQPKIEP